MNEIRLEPGMILTLKKSHPCGSAKWKVLRTGADVKLECMGCGHLIVMPRYKLKKMIRAAKSPENNSSV